MAAVAALDTFGVGEEAAAANAADAAEGELEKAAGGGVKEESPTRAMWGGAAAYIKPLADAKEAKAQLASPQQQQRIAEYQQRIAGALPGGGGGWGAARAHNLHEPKQQRPATAGVRRSAEGGKVDIAAARKAAAAASRAAVRASRPTSAAPSAGARAGAETADADVVEEAPPPVEFTPPVVRPKTASASIPSTTAGGGNPSAAPVSPPLAAESSMVPVMVGLYQLRIQFMHCLKGACVQPLKTYQVKTRFDRCFFICNLCRYVLDEYEVGLCTLNQVDP
jgi:hypothetical protein